MKKCGRDPHSSVLALSGVMTPSGEHRHLPLSGVPALSGENRHLERRLLPPIPSRRHLTPSKIQCAFPSLGPDDFTEIPVSWTKLWCRCGQFWRSPLSTPLRPRSDVHNTRSGDKPACPPLIRPVRQREKQRSPPRTRSTQKTLPRTRSAQSTLRVDDKVVLPSCAPLRR